MYIVINTYNLFSEFIINVMEERAILLMVHVVMNNMKIGFITFGVNVGKIMIVKFVNATVLMTLIAGLLVVVMDG